MGEKLSAPPPPAKIQKSMGNECLQELMSGIL